MQIKDYRHSLLVISLVLVSTGCPVPLEIEGDSASTTVGSQAATSEPTGGQGSSTAGPVECTPPNAAGPTWTTVSVGGGSGKHWFHAVAIDGAGDTYAAGFSVGDLLLPGMPAAITSEVQRPIVAKFDCAGDLLWLTVGEASASATADAVILSHDGESVYVGGGSESTLEFAAATLEPGAYVLRVAAATGAVQAGITLGSGASQVRALARLADGADDTVYAAGGCSGVTAGILVAELAPTLVSAAVRCNFATEVAPSKDVVTEALSIAVLAKGDVIVGGRVTGALEDRPLSTGVAGFVARRATGPGAVQSPDKWFVSIARSTSLSGSVKAVAVMNDGSIVAGGKGHGVDEASIPGPGPTCGTACDPALYPAMVRAYVASLDPETGMCRDNRIFCSGGGASPSPSEDIFALAPADGGLYVSGQYTDSLVIGGVEAAFSERGIGMFAVRLAPTLELDWALSSEQDSDTNCESGNSIEMRSRVYGRAIAARGDDVAIAGAVCGKTIRIGPQTLSTADDQHHAFVAWLTPAL